MELAVAALEGVADLPDGFHDVQTADEVHIDAAGVADESENGMICAHGDVHAEILTLKPVDQLIALFL